MPSKRTVWASWIIEVIVGLFLLFDAGIHTVNPPFVAQSFAQLGYNPSIGPVIGIIELILVILYLIPRTSVWGALFLTGYLGGAVATNVRVGLPLFTNILFPVYVAIFMWGALWLRNASLRQALLF